MIAAFQRNISQHLGKTCKTCCAHLATLLQCVVMCWVLLAQNLTVFKLNQQNPRCCNKVAKHAHILVPNNIVLACCVVWLGFQSPQCHRNSNKLKSATSIKIEFTLSLPNLRFIKFVTVRVFPKPDMIERKAGLYSKAKAKSKISSHG